MFAPVGVLYAVWTATVKFTKLGLVYCCHTQKSAGMLTIATKQSAAQNLIRSENLLKCKGVMLWTRKGIRHACWVRFFSSIETCLRWILHIIIHLLGVILKDCIIQSRLRTVLHNIRAGTVCPASSNHEFSTVIPADW